MVFILCKTILAHIFSSGYRDNLASIETYIYDNSIKVGYSPNVFFGKHLGVFGNTGSGKICTVVSIIQNYIRNNTEKDIKFIILDVNGEHEKAFKEYEMDYISFENLRFHHSMLSNFEYGKMFQAADGI